MEKGNENKGKASNASNSSVKKIKKAVSTSKVSATAGSKSEKSTKAKAGPELSDELRKLGQKYDESDYRHWIPTLLADRVGQIEDLLENLAPDNTVLDSIVEFGRTTDWTADKKAIIKKAASTIGAASFDAVTTAISRKIRARDEEE